MENEALRFLGAGLATLGMIGAAIGVGHIFSGLMSGIARNPSMEDKLFQKAIIGAGLSEALGILAFVIAMMVLFVKI